MFLIRVVLTLCVAASMVVGKPVIIDDDDDDFCSTVDESEDSPEAQSDRDKDWPNGEVPYTFDEGVFNEAEKEKIKKAMKDLEQYGVQFKRRINEKDYVEINRDKPSRCNANVGRIGGRQSLNLGEGCMGHHIIVHELMHALGFSHEQNRSDRDNYVKIMFENIKKGKHRNFNKHNPKIYEKVPYDFESIMHYKENSASKNRKLPTIIPHKPYVKYATKMGTYKKISARDIQKLEIMYPSKS